MVGSDVWFGHGVAVLSGVRIGDGAIVGAAGVPDYRVVGGNPARLIRARYSDQGIARLLAVAWWDWPAEHSTEHPRTIMSGSIADLEAATPHNPW